jgi:SAM-dependent methyltransferase
MPSPNEFSHDVFLSHQSSDKLRVRALAERLQASGVRVWFDEWAITPGDNIFLAIEKGLQQSRTLVLCLSPAALGSDWVGLERSTTLFRDPSNAGRRFIPLLLTDCDLPDTLRQFKYVDFRQESEAAFRELLAPCRPGNTTAHIAYTYPDPEDRVTFATIRALEPMPGYWSESDGKMRQEFLGRLLADFRQGRDLNGIDVGCGYGRLIPWLLDMHCRQVTALEPDRTRLAVAKSRIDQDQSARVSFVDQTIQDFAPKVRFDLILCSHLIQHVQRTDLDPILSKLHTICSDDARVVLFTAQSTTGADRFMKARLNSQSAFSEDAISAEEFDGLIANPQGVLPIRFFSLKTLTAALQNAGLKVLDHYVYHCCEGNFGDLDKHCFRDKVVNAVPELKKQFGRDIAVVAAPA